MLGVDLHAKMSVVPDPGHPPESPEDYKKKIAELEELIQIQELIADISGRHPFRSAFTAIFKLS